MYSGGFTASRTEADRKTQEEAPKTQVPGRGERYIVNKEESDKAAEDDKINRACDAKEKKGKCRKQGKEGDSRGRELEETTHKLE